MIIIKGAPPSPQGLFRLSEVPQQVEISQRTYSTGWWELDQLFKPYLGEYIVITGKAGSGKSTLVFNLLCNLARDHDLRAAIYIPENELDIRAKLKRIWLAKGSNADSFERYAAAQCFVRSATHFVEREQGDRFEPRTIQWVLDNLEYAVRFCGCSIVMVDPWNELERLKQKEELLSDYICRCIGFMKDFCRNLNVMMFMVAHPTKAIMEGQGRLPTLYDIEGSAHWANKADAGLIVARGDNNRSQVIVDRVREQGEAGKPGKCYFQVDPVNGLYVPEYGGVT